MTTIDIGLLQTLLNASACIGNSLTQPQSEASRTIATRTYKQVVFQIEQLRDKVPPPCYGEDDCSTLVLSTCPWRMTCGS